MLSESFSIQNPGGETHEDRTSLHWVYNAAPKLRNGSCVKANKPFRAFQAITTHPVENSHHLTLALPVLLLQRYPRHSRECCWFMSIQETTHKLSHCDTTGHEPSRLSEC